MQKYEIISALFFRVPIEYCNFRVNVPKSLSKETIDFSFKDFFSKYKQIWRMQIWSYLLKESVKENLMFVAA